MKMYCFIVVLGDNGDNYPDIAKFDEIVYDLLKVAEEKGLITPQGLDYDIAYVGVKEEYSPIVDTMYKQFKETIPEAVDDNNFYIRQENTPKYQKVNPDYEELIEYWPEEADNFDETEEE